MTTMTLTVQGVTRGVLKAVISLLLALAAVQALRGSIFFVNAHSSANSPFEILVICGVMIILSYLMLLNSRNPLSTNFGRRFSSALCVCAIAMSAVGLVLPVGMMLKGLIS